MADAMDKRSHEFSAAGLAGALETLRSPVLLLAAPLAFAVGLVVGYEASWEVGFDFRGTVWEPARALLDGARIYPEPTTESIAVGNPSVYPPLVFLLATPLALLTQTLASWLWVALLACAVPAALKLLGVRDWRCYVVAGTSPVVVHGVFFGNLTVLLVIPIALAWRYRNAACACGLAIGGAIAAKLFVVPLLAWLLLTRRYRALGWATGFATTLLLGSWAIVGLEGLADYPALLQAVQEVYAVRSNSLATIAAGFGAPVSLAVGLCVCAGLALVVLATWTVRRPNGDVRAFALVVTACVVSSPIVWLGYLALLFVPIALVWRTFSPIWLFGYAVWLAGAIIPKPTGADVCCRPSDVLPQAWASSHAEPDPWFALTLAAVTLLVGLACAFAPFARHSTTRTAEPVPQ